MARFKAAGRGDSLSEDVRGGCVCACAGNLFTRCWISSYGLPFPALQSMRSHTASEPCHLPLNHAGNICFLPIQNDRFRRGGEEVRTCQKGSRVSETRSITPPAGSCSKLYSLLFVSWAMNIRAKMSSGSTSTRNLAGPRETNQRNHDGTSGLFWHCQRSQHQGWTRGTPLRNAFQIGRHALHCNRPLLIEPRSFVDQSSVVHCQMQAVPAHVAPDEEVLRMAYVRSCQLRSVISEIDHSRIGSPSQTFAESFSPPAHDA